MPRGHKGERQPHHTGPTSASAAERELRRAKLVKLLRQGVLKSEAARVLGISASQVTNDWKIIIRQTQGGYGGPEEIVAQKMQEISEVKMEAWKAWERSTQSGIKHRVKIGPDGEPELDEDGNEVWEEYRDSYPGEAQFLKIILECFKQERDLLGLDTPKTTILSGQVTQTNVEVGIDFDAFTQLDQVPDMIEQRIAEVTGQSQERKVVEQLSSPSTNGQHEPRENGDGREDSEADA